MCILDHPNIVALQAVICELSHYGIVMEHAYHGSLEDYIGENDVRACMMFIF